MDKSDTRYIRYLGAGSPLRIRVARIVGNQAQYVDLTALLDDAGGDSWQGANSNDLAVAVFHAAGYEEAADFTYWTKVAGRHRQMGGGDRADRAISLALFDAVGVRGVWDEYNRRILAGEVSKQRGIEIITERAALAFEHAFRFTKPAVTGTYHESRRRGLSVEQAYDRVMATIKARQKAALGLALEAVWRRRGGVQIPPELVASTYNGRFTVVPEYWRVDPHSPLARVLLQSDYLGKQLLHPPDLDKKIPRYQTEFAWRKARGSTAREEGTYRMWISVAAVDAAQSPDGSVLETRSARMRYNIRRTDVHGQERPTTHTGYEQLLTSLYDDFAVEFPCCTSCGRRQSSRPRPSG